MTIFIWMRRFAAAATVCANETGSILRTCTSRTVSNLLGPVAKFVSEPGNGRIGSAFELGCPRMAVVKCGPARPIPRPFSNFATGPHMARFYALAVDRDLFGQVLLMRQWGRIGTSCRTRYDPHPTEAEAFAALAALARTKRARGYAEPPDPVASASTR